MGYAKGGNIQVGHYAAGGAVLGRTREFMKEPDEFRSDAQGKGDAEDQDYGKAGPAKGNANPKASGKQLKTVKPRK